MHAHNKVPGVIGGGGGVGGQSVRGGVGPRGAAPGGGGSGGISSSSARYGNGCFRNGARSVRASVSRGFAVFAAGCACYGWLAGGPPLVEVRGAKRKARRTRRVFGM